MIGTRFAVYVKNVDLGQTDPSFAALSPFPEL
jgi:hypothetical protein